MARPQGARSVRASPHRNGRKDAMSEQVIAPSANAALAAPAEQISAEALIALPEVQAPLVSPDGLWVAWTWLGRDPVACVYAAPTDGSAPPRRLTHGPHGAVAECWSADGRDLVLALTDGGDEKVRLHLVAVEGGAEPRLLTDPAPGYFIVGGDLHPNGRWLIYAANADEQGTGSSRRASTAWISRPARAACWRARTGRPRRARA
jgi:dipeptidyl aminopeptidase/acylaminoacyl peptidase